MTPASRWIKPAVSYLSASSTYADSPCPIPTEHMSQWTEGECRIVWELRKQISIVIYHTFTAVSTLLLLVFDIETCQATIPRAIMLKLRRLRKFERLWNLDKGSNFSFDIVTVGMSIVKQFSQYSEVEKFIYHLDSIKIGKSVIMMLRTKMKSIPCMIVRRSCLFRCRCWTIMIYPGGGPCFNEDVGFEKSFLGSSLN